MCGGYKEAARAERDGGFEAGNERMSEDKGEGSAGSARKRKPHKRLELSDLGSGLEVQTITVLGRAKILERGL